MYRRSTVYDFSSLNIRSDRPRAGAGDSYDVPKYKKIDLENPVDDGVAHEDLDADFVQENRLSVNSKGKDKEIQLDADDHGPRKKRRKLVHDFGFLETGILDVPGPSAAVPVPSAFAVPSSDLLKCIHHFACNYYTERSQLFNASQIFRKARKERRLAKLARQQEQQLQDSDSEGDGASSDEQEEEQPQPDADSRSGRRKKMNLKEDRRRDMYKTMDGSALLAIGMLLQEHVASMLTLRIPDGWEQIGGEKEEWEGTDGDGDDETETQVEGEEDEDGEGSGESAMECDTGEHGTKPLVVNEQGTIISGQHN
ncbi:hypothetical protein GGX14DRAFT_650115 [Mycena pura]|uniref:Uncharacterized protein n=1 Tax=Mycena pura TaxID=153505 RepID=A0AAD7E2T0_9AGAR|nr:hypothetical protein GGX14DRAFT_650115 [Mycena pura]